MIDRFASPWAFALLLLLPLIVLAWHRRRAPGVLFSSASLFTDLPSSWRTRLRFTAPMLLLGAIASLIVGLARPQKLIGRVPQSGEGIAIEIVLDRSGSMREEMDAEDGSTTTKFQAVKKLIRDFMLGDGKELKGRPDDVVGLVTFARFADTVAPLSRSREILVTLAEQTTLALVRGEDGTAIGEGLALGAARLRDMDARNQTGETPTPAPPTDPGAAPKAGKVKSKIIVLMTDGQNNAGAIDPMQAAGLAKQWGLKVYTIGIGAGADRAARRGDPFANLRAAMGSGVDEGTLKAIAETTGGRYFAASDAAALREVYSTIDKLERSSLHTPESTLYEELFAPWVMAGAAGVLASALLRATLFRSIA